MMTAGQAKARSDAHGFDTGRECKVQQHLKDEVDVNTIVRRFGLTGELPQGVPQGVYADLTGIEDLESAVHLVDTVRARFQGLPAEVRDRFGNDPVLFASSVQAYTDYELERLTGSVSTPGDSGGGPPEAPAAPAPAPGPAGPAPGESRKG